MSLINDALKRARQSRPQPAAPLAVPAWPPVEGEPRGGPASFLPLAVTLLLAVACSFIALAFFIPQKPVAQTMPAPQNARNPAPVPVEQNAQKMSPPPAPAQPVAAAVPKLAPPALKVQGIFYNNAQWQAIVNGQSVLVDGSVDGYRVKLISKDNVSFVAPDGTEKTMTLGE